MKKLKLAIKGGSKSARIEGKHYTWPKITKATKRAILKQLDSGPISIYYREGVVAKFEDQFKNYHQRKYGLVCNSGTSALHSCFVGIGLREGDEVIAPAYTFFATVTPVLFTGAVPILVDAKEDGNIDPQLINKAITRKTKAIIVTHMWGIPCDMDEITRIVKENNLFLIEDCSHAHGATYKGKLAGTFGHTSAWSLQGQKIITGGECGIMLTDDEEIYYRANLLGHFNKRCKQEIPLNHPLHKFWITGMGLKYRAHPLAVAMATEQFSHLTRWLKRKREVAKYMDRKFKNIPGIQIPLRDSFKKPSWYAYILQYKGEQLSNLPIEKFFTALKAEGLEALDRPESTQPLNLLPLFQTPGELFPGYKGKFSYKKGQFPVAEHFFEKALKLPVWIDNKAEKIIDQYAKAFWKVVDNYKELLKNDNRR